MKLKDCTMGRLVKTSVGDIGHIVGLTYSIHVKFTRDMSPEELENRTIPLIKFADGTERGVHPNSLSLYN